MRFLFLCIVVLMFATNVYAQKVTVKERPKLTNSIKTIIDNIDRYVKGINENKTLQKQGMDGEITEGGNFEDYFYVDTLANDTLKIESNILNTKKNLYVTKYLKGKMVVYVEDTSETEVNSVE